MPLNPSVQDVIHFTDTSIDIDVGDTIVQWLWEFGDGTTADVQNPIKEYDDAGVYQVNLTVWDNNGSADIMSRNITVSLPTLDYVIITHGAGNEVLDATISTDLSVTLYASGYNNTYGYLGLMNASWGISNNGSNASLNVTQGEAVTYYSGWLDGTSTIEVTKNGVSDTVILSLDSQLFSMVIYRGWNLITIPFSHTWTADTLGENLTGCTVITKFNADTQDFSTHIVGIPWDDFPIEDGVGYFAYASTDSIFTMTGSPITTVMVDIYPNWNIIGWFNQNHTSAESLGENITDCTLVILFTSQTQTFTTHVVGTPWNNYAIKRGMAIFISSSSESNWQGEG
jgi:PKD repeat protein